MAVGLAGLWALNIVRIIVLVEVSHEWYAAVLEEVNAQIRWIFFAVFTLAFWTIVFRFLEPCARRGA